MSTGENVLGAAVVFSPINLKSDIELSQYYLIARVILEILSETSMRQLLYNSFLSFGL